MLNCVKSIIGRYTDVIQSWVVGCDDRNGSFPDHAHPLPTMLMVTYRLFIDLTRLPNSIHDCSSFLTTHGRFEQFITIGNRQGYLGQVHRPLRTFQDPSLFFPDFLTTSQDLSKCDWGLSAHNLEV